MKPKLLFEGPIFTNSGYGVASRQLLDALLRTNTFDIFLRPLAWGRCSWSYSLPNSGAYRQLALNFENATKAGFKNYDVQIMVSIPNELERKADICVLATAGIESDTMLPTWVDGCNRADLIIVPSEFASRAIKETDIEGKRVTKPVMVMPHSVDVSLFNNEDNFNLDLDFETDFNFLCVGQWSRGSYGEDRKDIGRLIKWFYEVFYDNPNVGLVLKVNGANNTKIDKSITLKKINEIKTNIMPKSKCKVYLVHGHMKDEDIASLYKHPKINAIVNLGCEGFWLPGLEAGVSDLPIIALNWSGHLDYLNKGNFTKIDYSVEEVPESSVNGGFMVKGAKWGRAIEGDFKQKITKFYKSPGVPKEWAKALGKRLREEYQKDTLAVKFVQTFISFLNEFQNSGGNNQELTNLRQEVNLEEDNVLFVLPQSAGDVFLSTAVIDSIKKKHPDHNIYYATSNRFFPLLEGNGNVHKTIEYSGIMNNLDLMERMFEYVYAPFLHIQMQGANWVRKGKGRNLVEEIAAQCDVEVGDFHVPIEKSETPEKYITFAPGSGKEKWAARNYVEWQEVINNLNKLLGDRYKICQVGSPGEKLYDGVEDFRNERYSFTAGVLYNSSLHLSIDTFSMHVASNMGKPIVALFGSSYPKSTGPLKVGKHTKLLETTNRWDCGAVACYKDRCGLPGHENKPCINEIDPVDVFKAVKEVLVDIDPELDDSYEYEINYPSLSGYTTIYNGVKFGYPFEESVRSLLGVCDEVIVVDGGSEDGTQDALDKLVEEFPEKLQVYHNEIDWEDPGWDGQQKAFARALCTGDYCIQLDADEVIHEGDYQYYRDLTKKWPDNAEVVALPIVELWGNEKTVTARRHAWKWRISKNEPHITHGIPDYDRVVDEKTGKVYSSGKSDGCFPINVMTNQMIPTQNWYRPEFEELRTKKPEAWAGVMNDAFNKLPTTYHYSWCDLPRKVKNFAQVWDKGWDVLYQREKTERFPGVETDEQVDDVAHSLFNMGAEKEDDVKHKFELKRSNPKVMNGWLKNRKLQ